MDRAHGLLAHLLARARTPGRVSAPAPPTLAFATILNETECAPRKEPAARPSHAPAPVPGLASKTVVLHDPVRGVVPGRGAKPRASDAPPQESTGRRGEAAAEHSATAPAMLTAPANASLEEPRPRSTAEASPTPTKPPTRQVLIARATPTIPRAAIAPTPRNVVPDTPRHEKPPNGGGVTSPARTRTTPVPPAESAPKPSTPQAGSSEPRRGESVPESIERPPIAKNAPLPLMPNPDPSPRRGAEPVLAASPTVRVESLPAARPIKEHTAPYTTPERPRDLRARTHAPTPDASSRRAVEANAAAPEPTARFASREMPRHEAAPVAPPRASFREVPTRIAHSPERQTPVTTPPDARPRPEPPAPKHEALPAPPAREVRASSFDSRRVIAAQETRPAAADPARTLAKEPSPSSIHESAGSTARPLERETASPGVGEIQHSARITLVGHEERFQAREPVRERPVAPGRPGKAESTANPSQPRIATETPRDRSIDTRVLRVAEGVARATPDPTPSIQPRAPEPSAPTPALPTALSIAVDSAPRAERPEHLARIAGLEAAEPAHPEKGAEGPQPPPRAPHLPAQPRIHEQPPAQAAPAERATQTQAALHPFAASARSAEPAAELPQPIRGVVVEPPGPVHAVPLPGAAPAATPRTGHEAAERPGPPPALASVTRVIVEQGKLEPSSLKLRLDHDQLGGIDISFSRGPRGLLVEISALSSDTRHLLTGHAASIAQEIRAAGVDLQSITVAGGLAHDPQGSGHGREQADPAPAARFGSASASLGNPIASTEQRSPGSARRGSSLDLLA